jgi:hypothetical protein
MILQANNITIDISSGNNHTIFNGKRMKVSIELVWKFRHFKEINSMQNNTIQWKVD